MIKSSHISNYTILRGDIPVIDSLSIIFEKKQMEAFIVVQKFQTNFFVANKKQSLLFGFAPCNAQILVMICNQQIKFVSSQYVILLPLSCHHFNARLPSTLWNFIESTIRKIFSTKVSTEPEYDILGTSFPFISPFSCHTFLPNTYYTKYSINCLQCQNIKG